MPRLSPLASRLQVQGSAAWQVHQRAMDRRDAGEDVIVLSLGDPDFTAPEPVLEAAIASLRGGRTHYTPARGEPALLSAIAAAASRQAGVDVAADRVVFLPGAQAALYGVMACLAGDGEEVAVPEPAYTTYRGVIAACGARMVAVPLNPEREWHLDIADLEAALTPRTRAVLVNTPH